MKNLIVTILVGFGLLLGSIGCSSKLLQTHNYSGAEPDSSYLLVHTKDKVHLVDGKGNSFHSWPVKGPVMYSYLKPNGNLLYSRIGKYKDFRRSIGGGGYPIVELNWEGKEVWRYHNEYLHHDFLVLKNGNLLAWEWENLPPSFVRRIPGGKKGSEKKGMFFGDRIIEVNRKGEVVWSWSTYKNVHPKKLKIPGYLERYEWNHANSMEYIDSNPFTQTPALLVSFGHNARLLLIEISTKQVLWMSKEGLFPFQHDPSLLPNGEIMVFDNGRMFSRIVFLDPKSDQVTKVFTGGKELVKKVQFFSRLVGSAQLLRNGNYFIHTGQLGFMAELDKNGQKVWEAFGPYDRNSTDYWPHQFSYKIKRYYNDNGVWTKKL